MRCVASISRPRDMESQFHDPDRSEGTTGAGLGSVATAKTHNNRAKPPVDFLAHDGQRFIFPFELCETYESFKKLLEQTYVRAPESVRENIREERYDILTADDQIILPSVWELVLKDHLTLQESKDFTSHTIKIALWSNLVKTESRQGRPAVATGSEEIIFTEKGLHRNITIRDHPETKTSDHDFVIEVDKNGKSRVASRSPSPIRDRVNTLDSYVSRGTSRSRSRDRDRHRRRGGSGSSDSSRRRAREAHVHYEPPNRSRSRSPSLDSDYSDISDGTGSSTLTTDEDKDSEWPDTPPRNVFIPLDEEGNRLSYLVDTKWPSNRHGQQSAGDKMNEQSNKSPVAPNMKVENPLKILKALQVQSEARMNLEIHKLEAPETSFATAGVSIRWHHLYGDQLDLTQFKTTCLGIPDITERSKLLVTKLFERLEQDKLDAFLDGMFIKPGTVLRTEESNRDDAQWVIFSCVPYFDVRPPLRSSPTKGDRLHPPRTLMQSYYPYEPVRDRDMEQAFKKYKGGSSKSIIHVPSMWILNMGSHTVVSCGYNPLKDDFVKSITVVKEDLRSLNTSASSSGETKVSTRSTNIRLTDWVGRTLLYTIDECGTYFELEQKLRELRYFTREASDESMDVVWVQKAGVKKASPANWLEIIRTRDLIFIDLSIRDSKKFSMEENDQDILAGSTVPRISTPPFFHWPHPTKKENKVDGGIPNSVLDPKIQQSDALAQDVKRSMHCVEVVEKLIFADAIDKDDATNDVDRAFTSSEYYQTLSESTLQRSRDTFVHLVSQNTVAVDEASSKLSSWHEVIVQKQTSQLTEEAATLIDIVNETLTLFVKDVDKGSMMRKVFGAMENVAAIVENIHNRGPLPEDPKEWTDPEWLPPRSKDRSWFIRAPKLTPQSAKFIPLPDDTDLKASTTACKKCRRSYPWETPNLALEHLQSHLDNGDLARRATSAKAEAELKNWIRNSDQLVIEETLAAHLAILTKANEEARKLLLGLRELSWGVQIKEGRISELYTFPHELLRTLRRLVVFYLAIERALQVTENALDPAARDSSSSSLNSILETIEKFEDSVQTSLLAARKDLCNMARSTGHDSIAERLALGPEYICAWYMRRLLVRPVDDSMTVSDLYREYLSTVQFQVNHRPGKRLLRSINLLQEELRAIKQVNAWQAKLIDSYSKVLSEATYQNDMSSRRSLYPYEKLLLSSCRDNLSDVNEDLTDLLRRIGPLSESTKQWAEINEEDHGKAIFVFTVVTAIFLPLSFVTSYLGMNTADIRDMGSNQALFWEIAIPLTAVTMGSIVFIAYNGDDFRDGMSNLYRRITGKEITTADARGISVSQRKRASHLPSTSSSTVDYRSFADEAEYSPPRPVWNAPKYYQEGQLQAVNFAERHNKSYVDVGPQTVFQTEQIETADYPGAIQSRSAARIMANNLGTDPVPNYITPTRPTTRSAAVYSSGPPRLGVSGVPDDPYGPPTFIKIHKKYLDADTLAHFNLPWEYDTQDPDYYIIFRNLPTHETDMLFEHTKRLRSGQKDRTYYDSDLETGGKKEYAWVRSRTRSRARGSENTDYRRRHPEEDGRDSHGRTTSTDARATSVRRSRGNFVRFMTGSGAEQNRREKQSDYRRYF